jgi:hypothetical protein
MSLIQRLPVQRKEKATIMVKIGKKAESLRLTINGEPLFRQYGWMSDNVTKKNETQFTQTTWDETPLPVWKNLSMSLRYDGSRKFLTIEMIVNW